MELQLDLLRTFLAIIDSGGFTNASKVVFRSQSAISLQVKRLEEPLVNRCLNAATALSA